MNQITILYENHPNPQNSKLQIGWGFSAFIEYERKRILFDTGWDGQKLLENMKILKISFDRIDAIFLSHIHWDHTGGLPSVLHNFPCKYVFTPKNYSENQGREIAQFGPEVFIMESFTPLVNVSSKLYSTGTYKATNEVHEQALLIQKKNEKYILIVGCSHPGLEAFYSNLPSSVCIETIIGGVHGYKNVDFLIQKQTREFYIGHCTEHTKLFSERKDTNFRPLIVGLTIPI